MGKDTPNYETVLTFLSCATRTLDETARNTCPLDAKLAYHKEMSKFQDAYRLLRANYYAFESWCETGEYIPPTTRTFPVCKECGQIPNH